MKPSHPLAPEPRAGAAPSAGSVLAALAERLESALGQDPWALGHRSAALAFAARLVDEDELDALEATGEPHDPEVVAVLRRYLANARDTRGFHID